MTLAKAGARAKSKTKHFYSTGINYDRHLQLSKYLIVQATIANVVKAFTTVIDPHSMVTLTLFFYKTTVPQ